MKKGKAFFQKYRELILYIFFGGLTTLVNLGSYLLLSEPLRAPYLAASVLAQVLSILFAYVTNRIWVFESKVHGFRGIAWEMAQFFACRGASLLLDLGFMWVGVELFHLNDKVMKLFANLLVIAANYIFSKLFIFRKPSPPEQ